MSWLFFIFIYSLTCSASLTIIVIWCEKTLHWITWSRTVNLYQFEWHVVSTDVVLSTTCFHAVSLLSLGLTTEKISLFSSIEFLLTNYRTYNLMMEWSYEYVVRWAIRNLNIDDITAARLRGKFWSVRRREALSPLFTWCHLSRRCASGILLYSWFLSMD